MTLKSIGRIDPATQSCDSIVFTDLKLTQHKQGYRFNLDSILLARLAHVSKNSKLLDLGCGMGTVALLLGRLHPSARVTGVDCQADLIALARQNAQTNNVSKRVSFICDDLAKPLVPKLAGSFTAVFCNPPYYLRGQGRLPKSESMHRAKHTTREDFTALIKNSRSLVKSGGYLHMVYSAERISELLCELVAGGFQPKKLRFIHPRIDQPANAVFLSARSGGKSSLTVLPPLVVYNSRRQYAEEVRHLLYET